MRTSRLTYANVVSTLALVVAVGGGGAAVAAGLAKNSVGSPQIKSSAVKTSDLGKDAVTSSKVRTDALTGADIKESTLGPVPAAITAQNVYHAVVAANGELVVDQSGPGISTEDPEEGLGDYAVIFPRDVTECAAVASVTAPGVGAPGTGTAATTQRHSNAKGIYVSTFNESGTRADRPFALVVVC